MKYFYQNGTKAADDAVAYKKPGEQYSIVSPTIEGFTPGPRIVSGITSGNLTRDVRYLPNVDPGPIPDIDDEPLV